MSNDSDLSFPYKFHQDVCFLFTLHISRFSPCSPIDCPLTVHHIEISENVSNYCMTRSFSNQLTDKLYIYISFMHRAVDNCKHVKYLYAARGGYRHCQTAYILHENGVFPQPIFDTEGKNCLKKETNITVRSQLFGTVKQRTSSNIEFQCDPRFTIVNQL